MEKHNYNVTYSGSAGDDKSWKYFISLDREMSGDTKYKDGLTGGNYTYRGTEFKEEGANIRIDKDFSDTETYVFGIIIEMAKMAIQLLRRIIVLE